MDKILNLITSTIQGISVVKNCRTLQKKKDEWTESETIKNFDVPSVNIIEKIYLQWKET